MDRRRAAPAPAAWPPVLPRGGRWRRCLRRRPGAADAARIIVAVERETPVPPGLVPAALPQDIPNNHLVYALTWFGLAGVPWCGSISPCSFARLEADEIRLHTRRRAGGRFPRRAAGRPGPRRRALCAGGLAEPDGRRDRRLRRRALPPGRRRYSGPLRRRGDRRRRPGNDLRSRLCQLHPSGDHAPAPDRARRVPAGAVPWPDPGLQGRGHAAAGRPLRARPGPSRADHDHRLRHLGRHRRGGGGGLSRPRQCADRRAVSARAGSPRSNGGS